MSTLGLVAEVVEQDVPPEGPDVWLLAAAHPRGAVWLREQLRCVLGAVALAEQTSPSDVWRSLESTVPVAGVWEGSIRPGLERATAEAISASARPEVESLLASVEREFGGGPVEFEVGLHDEAIGEATDELLLLSATGTPGAVDLLERYLLVAVEAVALAHGQSPAAVLDLFRDHVAEDEEWESEERPVLAERAQELLGFERWGRERSRGARRG